MTGDCDEANWDLSSILAGEAVTCQKTGFDKIDQSSFCNKIDCSQGTLTSFIERSSGRCSLRILSAGGDVSMAVAGAADQIPWVLYTIDPLAP